MATMAPFPDDATKVVSERPTPAMSHAPLAVPLLKALGSPNMADTVWAAVKDSPVTPSMNAVWRIVLSSPTGWSVIWIASSEGDPTGSVLMSASPITVTSSTFPKEWVRSAGTKPAWPV